MPKTIPKKVKEIAHRASLWLSEHYPTNGDGMWGDEFIIEVFYGKHLGHVNRKTVLLALASVE